MSDAADGDAEEELAEIRARKRRRLRERVEGDDLAGADDSAPDEPIPVEGPDHLAELLADEPLVFADFHADWCGPCQMVEPHVEALAAETEAAVAKVDVDRHQGLAAEYGARSIPTFLIFVDGEPVDRLRGAQSRDALFSAVRRHA